MCKQMKRKKKKKIKHLILTAQTGLKFVQMFSFVMHRVPILHQVRLCLLFYSLCPAGPTWQKGFICFFLICKFNYSCKGLNKDLMQRPLMKPVHI